MARGSLSKLGCKGSGCKEVKNVRRTSIHAVERMAGIYIYILLYIICKYIHLYMYMKYIFYKYNYIFIYLYFVYI